MHIDKIVYLDHSRPYPILCKDVKRFMTHKLSVVHLQDVFGMRCCVVIEEEGATRHLDLYLDPTDSCVVEYLAHYL